MIAWLQELPPLAHAGIGFTILMTGVIAITATEAHAKRRRIREQLRQRRIEASNHWRPRSTR